MDDIDQLIDRVRRLHREQHVSAYGYRVLLDALGKLKEGDKLLAAPVAYQHCYPDGTWRVNNGEPINGLLPVASRPLYAPL